MSGFSRVSLLWKILLSTSVLLAALFALTGFIVQQNAVSTMTQTLDEEVKTSFEAYGSLWRARAEKLRAISLILSNMSDVRAAFSTRDQATIRDSAGELWAKISDENALFLVTDPKGTVIASLGGLPGASPNEVVPAVSVAARQFPKQVSGFVEREGRLYQIVITPVFVQSGSGPALINVLVAGFEIDTSVVRELKGSTGGSDFLFVSNGKAIISTLSRSSTDVLVARLRAGANDSKATDGTVDYTYLRRDLLNTNGEPIGRLYILRSFEAPLQRIEALQRQMILIGLGALMLGLVLTYWIARRIIEPVKELDLAAAEVGRQNYDVRVTPASEDEIGRLAQTFNSMCESIQVARAELIRQERLSTIGRLASSIVHDLRNPLAAIYGGAEMLVDLELSEVQKKRLAANIYRASRRIQELLQDLANVARGKRGTSEVCRLSDIVSAAVEACAAAAEAQGVQIETSVGEAVEHSLERARVERVFVNLISNALEAMKGPGWIRIWAETDRDGVSTVYVEDNGPGVPAEVRQKLFEPFVTAGKKGGLGLGLALSRQTIRDHGGEMWVQPAEGAKFAIRFPAAQLTPVSG